MGGCDGIIFSMRSGRLANFLLHERDALVADLLVERADGVRVVEVRVDFPSGRDRYGPSSQFVWNRMKLVWYGKLRSSQFICGGNGDR